LPSDGIPEVFRRVPDRMRPALDAFRAVVTDVERAQLALTDAIPTTRLPGRPLAEALASFDDALADAETSMPAWRLAELDDEWRSCSEGIADARREGARLRLRPQAPGGFEELVGVVADVLAPLDAFHLAADRFRLLARGR
jgi:hypothetical protein